MNFWNGKTVLITGHTGFKGSWLSIWLNKLGANVIGYSLDPYSDKDNFSLCNMGEKIVDIRGDIRDKDKLEFAFDVYNPEFVFHLAAQPLVLDSFKNPAQTYEINVLGTMNILECFRYSQTAQIAIIVTTDKCYENKKNYSNVTRKPIIPYDNYHNGENFFGFKEDDRLGGLDPYSSSKACCEILVSSYRDSFLSLENLSKHKKAIATARSGNVIGGGDWARDRLVPDCIRAIEKDLPIIIRNPIAIRPWQHVLESIRGYMMLAEKMYNDTYYYSGSYNFGPEEAVSTVLEIAYSIVNKYGKGYLVDDSLNKQIKEADVLLLNINKAKKVLGWNPILTFDDMIELTVDWYKNYKSEDVYKLCVSQINYYEDLLLSQILLNGLAF